MVLIDGRNDDRIDGRNNYRMDGRNDDRMGERTNGRTLVLEGRIIYILRVIRDPLQDEEHNNKRETIFFKIHFDKKKHQ